MGGITIFCEGKKTSLDYKLLNRILEYLSGNLCTLVTAGSKFSFSAFVQGYFSPDELQNKRYIIFRDRDFDVQPTSTVQLLQLYPNNPSITLTYRACVENYLLDANLIHTYWTEKYREKQKNSFFKWGHGDSPGIETITNWIETSTRNLKFYQAIRWALGDLSRTGAARKQLKTTWTDGSGTLPQSLDLESCKHQALNLIDEFREAVTSITREKFEESLNTYLQQFEQDNFWTQKQYLIWFHGKDIQKEMQRQQSNYISLSSYFENWAITKLDMDQHCDLVDLRTRIKQLYSS